MKDLAPSYNSIHVCPNNCILFRGDYADMDNCPECQASRWKYPERMKSTVKVLRYFPLAPRPKRLFASRKRAENMQWHALKRKPEKDLLTHPVDGAAWKAYDDDFKKIAADPRNVRLGIASDGFNPYGTMSTIYNVWPVFAVLCTTIHQRSSVIHRTTCFAC